MSSEGGMNFGPEWLRQLTGGSGNSGSPPNSPASEQRLYKLADHRYGREEMLALWPRNSRPPSSMVDSSPELVLEKSQIPLLIGGVSDDEQRCLHFGINSDAVLRIAGRTSSSVERGRGRARGGLPYTKRSSFDEEFNDRDARVKGGRGMGGVRGRSYDRTQSYHERWTSEQSGGNDDWPGPNKEPTSRSFKDNWRVQRDREAEDGWRPGASKIREGKSNWRNNSEWGPGPGKNEEYNGRGRGGGMERDVLPEWSTDNMESMGRFDDTGAFHGTDMWALRGNPEEGNSSSKQKNKEKRRRQGSRSDKMRSSIGDESEHSSQDDNISDEENNNSSHNERPSPQPQRDKPKMANKVPQQPVDKTVLVPSVNADETLKKQVPNNASMPLNIPVTTTRMLGPSLQDDKMEHIVSHLFDEDKETESPAETKWFYRDPQGEIQGPFETCDMVKWYKGGYFSKSLHVRRENSDRFVTLGDLEEQFGEPFSGPHKPVSHPSTSLPLPSAAPQPAGVNAGPRVSQGPSVTPGQPSNVVELLQQQQRLVQQQILHQHLVQQQQQQQQQEQFWRHQIQANQVASKLQQYKGWEDLTTEQKQQLIVQEMISSQQLPPGVGAGVANPLQQQLLSNKPPVLDPVDPIAQQLLSLPLPSQPNSLKELLAQTSVPTSMLKAPEAPAVENHLAKDPLQQLLLQMHSSSLLKGATNEETRQPSPLASDPIQSFVRQLIQGSAATSQLEESGVAWSSSEPGWSPATPPLSVPAWELLDSHMENSKTKEEQLEELRREEEKQKIEQERLRLQEERERFEEMKRQEELRRLEDRRRREELEKLEELRRQEEQRRKKEEEMMRIEEARRQEEARREEERRIEEARRREEEEEQKRIELELRKAQERKRKEEEKKRKEEEKLRKEEEKRRKEEEEQLRLQEDEARRREEERMRQEEERRIWEEEEKEQRKLLEAKQMEALSCLKEQQKKSKPVWGSSSQPSPSLLNIQKMQEDAEKQTAELVLKQQQEMALQEEKRLVALQQQEASKAAKQGWGSNPVASRQLPVKSFSEIQQEEEKIARKEKEQEKKASKHSNLPQQSVGVWSSASAKLSWPSPAPSSGHTNVWGNPTVPVAGSSPPQGFWDSPPIPQPSGKANRPLNNNKSGKNTKERRQEEERVKKLIQSKMQSRQAPHLEEFKKWCYSVLSSMKTDVDIPTFVPFLMEVESPYEVADYVKISLGETKEAQEFTRQFLEKRSRTKNEGERRADDDILGPAPANQPSAAFQEVKGKKKGKTGKKKMQKVDASILGFSVTAMPDRVNVGERDFVEGM